MANVILIAAVALLATVRPTPAERAASEFEVGQRWGAEPCISVAAHGPLLVSLVAMNRLDSMSGFIGDTRFVRRREVGDPGVIRPGSTSEHGVEAGKRVAAVIQSTSLVWQRPQHIRRRTSRERHRWRLQRPLRGAQVWLRRKQP